MAASGQEDTYLESLDCSKHIKNRYYLPVRGVVWRKSTFCQYTQGDIAKKENHHFWALSCHPKGKEILSPPIPTNKLATVTSIFLKKGKCQMNLESRSDQLSLYSLSPSAPPFVRFMGLFSHRQGLQLDVLQSFLLLFPPFLSCSSPQILLQHPPLLSLKIHKIISIH